MHRRIGRHRRAKRKKSMTSLNVTRHLYVYYSAPYRQRSIVMTVSVCTCLCVCLSIRKHISENTRPIFIKLFACYLWLWLGPPLVALRYVVYCQGSSTRLPADGSTAHMQPWLGYKRCVGIPVTGQGTHTHGSTFRAPRSKPH